MQTSEEIKRELMTCLVLNMSSRERHEAMRHTLLYIHRLEERNKSLQETNDSMLDLNGMLHRDMLEQRERADGLEAERDAAVAAIPRACAYCKWYGVKHGGFFPDCKNPNGCRNISGINTGWEWRGVQKEE